jgi:hypothetical protein
MLFANTLHYLQLLCQAEEPSYVADYQFIGTNMDWYLGQMPRRGVGYATAKQPDDKYSLHKTAVFDSFPGWHGLCK